jgi:hypothetical protein
VPVDATVETNYPGLVSGSINNTARIWLPLLAKILEFIGIIESCRLSGFAGISTLKNLLYRVSKLSMQLK